MGESIEGGKQVTDCEHRHNVTTITAGLARIVCEQCGRVSIRYEGEGAVWPEGSEAVVSGLATTQAPAAPKAVPQRAPASTPQKKPVCTRCGVPAVYITPWGLACGDHAWEAASAQDPLSDDFWIPLLVDRSDIAK